MAEKVNKEAEKELGKNVVVQDLGGLPPELLAEAAAMAGAGTSTAAEDNLIPHIYVLQDMSPYCRRRDPLYIEGAEPGMILITATKQLIKGDEGLLMQPCFFEKVINEWIPRDAGGGFAGRHLTMPGDAKEVQHPKNPERTIWVRPNGHELIDTRVQFVNAEPVPGTLLPSIVAFSSTRHQSHKAWMMQMNMAKLPDGKGGFVTAPSWFKKYRMKTTIKKNAQGEWFVPTFEDAGWVADAGQRTFGQRLFESVKSGAVKAAVDEMAGEEATGEVPI